MRRAIGLIALTLVVKSGLAWAGPGSASGPITVDSTTFVPGSSVMGTDGGVFGDSIPPVASTTTAAFRMTAYRAQHVNLRNASGVELGTVGNPLNVSGQTTVQLSTVTVTNSSFSVTGSTVNINGTVPVNITSSIPLTVLLATASVSGSSVTVTNGNINVTNTGFNVNNSPTVLITSTPAFKLNGATPAGANNIGTVSGSTVNIQGTIPISGSVSVSGSSVTVTNGFVAVSNTPNVYLTNVATVTVSGTPSVSVTNTPNVTVTNSSFSVTGSTVTINGTITALPSGTQNVYLVNPATATVSGTVSVSGSSMTVTNGSIAISNTPSVSVSNTPNVYLTNLATVTVSGTPSVNIVNIPTTTVQGKVDVTGSTVNVQGTFNAVLVGTQPVNVINQPTVNAAQSGTWAQTMQVLNSIGSPTSVGYTGGALQVPAQISDGVNTSSVTCNGGGCGLNVQIIGGAGAGGTSSSFGSSFPGPGTAAGWVGPTGLMQGARVDSSSDVYVNVANTSLSVTGSTVSISGTVAISTINAFNVSGSTVVISGTPNVNVSNTPNVSVTNTPNVSVTNTVATTLTAQIPTGTNNIGTVSGSSVTIFTSGGAALPVSGTVTVTPGSSAFPIISTNTLAVSPASGQAFPIISTTTLPISGTVTANAGTGTFSTTGSTVTILNTAGGTLAVSGTVAATQSGTWNTNATPIGTSTVTFNGISQPVTAAQTTPANLQASVSINGSSNTVSATQSGTWNVNATPVGTSTVTFNGVGQPVTQSGTWTDTVNQGANRWNINFSTTTTTAVLSSTATTSNVAISTPVAGLSSQTVRVFRLMLTADAATTITFRDGSTNFGDSQYLAANGSIVLDLTNEPWYITSSSNGFVIKQSGTANIGVRIWYTQS